VIKSEAVCPSLCLVTSKLGFLTCGSIVLLPFVGTLSAKFPMACSTLSSSSEAFLFLQYACSSHNSFRHSHCIHEINWLAIVNLASATFLLASCPSIPPSCQIMCCCIPPHFIYKDIGDNGLPVFAEVNSCCFWLVICCHPNWHTGFHKLCYLEYIMCFCRISLFLIGPPMSHINCTAPI